MSNISVMVIIFIFTKINLLPNYYIYFCCKQVTTEPTLLMIILLSLKVKKVLHSPVFR